jgi:hypothetical protein
MSSTLGRFFRDKSREFPCDCPGKAQKKMMNLTTHWLLFIDVVNSEGMSLLITHIHKKSSAINRLNAGTFHESN